MTDALARQPWIFLADKARGRMTIVRGGAGPAPVDVHPDLTVSDDLLVAWRLGDDLVAIEVDLGPSPTEAGEGDFADRAGELLRERLGINLADTVLGTAYHVLPGTFLWEHHGDLLPNRRRLR